MTVHAHLTWWLCPPPRFLLLLFGMFSSSCFFFPLCTPGDVQLLGLSVSGRLQRITAPVSREDAAAPPGSAAPVGRGVRELLSAIGDVCERQDSFSLLK